MRRRTKSAGAPATAAIETKLGNHSFPATGVTAYLKNGGTLEKAAAMGNHASTRTTQLYDRLSEIARTVKSGRIFLLALHDVVIVPA